MNTGIADAVGLGWRLAAILDGWADERVLDDYEAERRSVGEATSQAALKIDRDMKQIGRDPEFHADSNRGRTLREEAGRLIEQKDRQQWYSQGVQFGSRYIGSLGIAARPGGSNGTAIEDIGTYVPSADPGARFPTPGCPTAPRSSTAWGRSSLWSSWTIRTWRPGSPPCSTSPTRTAYR